MNRERTWKWLAIIAAVLALVAIGLTIVIRQFEPEMRERVVRVLEERYQSKVTLRGFHVSLFPRITVSGERLELRFHGRTDVPPLITLEKFSAHAGITSLTGLPIHISKIHLEKLRLTMPPKREASPRPASTGTSKTKGSDLLVIDEVEADGTFLTVLPKKQGKEPLEFDISKLRLHSVGKDRPMEFRATLTNPKPPGLIESNGHFGPWSSDEPGDTPVDGDYTFSNADLGVFKGIAGTLSSVGQYRGRLNNIDVKGTTDVPDFAIAHAGEPVHLTTSFHAVVDGTDGDTYLDPVRAKFGGTVLVCRGAVAHQDGGPPGKAVQLDVTMERGRVEDILRLAVKATPPMMNGAMQLHTRMLLPPGKGGVLDRLKLDGTFELAEARFEANGVQDKIAELSRRGQGRGRGSEDGRPPEVESAFRGTFQFDSATATFPRLNFRVPGSEVLLAGSFGLESEKIGFHGTLRTDAKVSQLVGGWKSVVLKPVDPFFHKNGAGAEIPIKIEGTRRDPHFGLDLFRKKEEN